MMDKMDYWRLCDELSVVEAALLIIGEDPSKFPKVMSSEENERPDNFRAAFSALSHAIIGGRLSATFRREAWERGWGEPPDDWDDEARTEQPGDGEKLAENVKLFPDQDEFSEEARALELNGIIYRAEPDWHLTTVLVEDLKGWLRGRGFKTGFFFPQADGGPNYLDKNYEKYAPKLAAAFNAWQAVIADPARLEGKTVKQALTIWLRKYAGLYGLTKDDGKPNEQGIKEIAKIANWDSKGGAPKTPG